MPGESQTPIETASVEGQRPAFPESPPQPNKLPPPLAQAKAPFLPKKGENDETWTIRLDTEAKARAIVRMALRQEQLRQDESERVAATPPTTQGELTEQTDLQTQKRQVLDDATELIHSYKPEIGWEEIDRARELADILGRKSDVFTDAIIGSEGPELLQALLELEKIGMAYDTLRDPYSDNPNFIKDAVDNIVGTNIDAIIQSVSSADKDSFIPRAGLLKIATRIRDDAISQKAFDYMIENFDRIIDFNQNGSAVELTSALIDSSWGERLSKLSELFSKEITDPKKAGVIRRSIANAVKNKGYVRELEDIFLNSYGLDPDQTHGAWYAGRGTSGVMDIGEVIQIERNLKVKNLEMIINLEAKRPGISKILSEEFGISHFARYPEELLVRQYDQRNTYVPYGVIMYPTGDDNGAFYNQTEILRNFGQQIEGRYAVRVYEAGGKYEAAKSFAKANKKYGSGYKISFAVIGGHGSPTSINFAREGTESTRLINSDIRGKGLARLAKDYFVEAPSVALFSCGTGMNPSGIDLKGMASEMSELGAEVVAPDFLRVHVKSLDAIFDGDGKIHLSATYAQGEEERIVPTARYLSGKKIKDN